MYLMNWLFGIGSALAETAGTTAAGTTAAATTATAGDAAAMTPTVGIVEMLLTTVLPMALIFVVFYFMLIRPQRKKDKQVKEMLNNLKVGDRICTIGGIYGTITGIRDESIVLTVGKQDMTMVVARWAIRSVEEVTIENDAEVLN